MISLRTDSLCLSVTSTLASIPVHKSKATRYVKQRKGLILPIFQALAGANFMWQNSSGGQVPPDAVAVGETSSNERLYVGRVLHDGTLTLGKVSLCRDQSIYVPWQGESMS